MKNYLLSFIAFAFLLNIANAQNNKPAIEIKSITLDAANSNCTVDYNLTDAEETEIDISVYLSADMGQTYLFPVEAIEGDGTVGTGDLQLNISYNTDSLDKYNIKETDLMFKIVANDNATVDINAMIDKVTPELLQGYMGEIEGIRHRTGGMENYLVTQYLLESSLVNGNYQNRSQEYKFNGGIEGKNVIARKPGHGNEADTYMISAHYDTVIDSPGADDNGSGVCGVLAAIEILKDYEFENSILLAGFDNEEDGLIGSSSFINKGIERYENIAGLLNFEMIGYYSEEPNTQTLPVGFNLLFPEAAQFVEDDNFKGDFIINTANTASVDLMNAFSSAALTYVPDLEVLSLETPGTGLATTDLRRSDHAPFWDKGYQALMITDGANFRNPHYHSPNDKSDVLDFNFMANVVKTTLATIANKAKISNIGFAEGQFSEQTGIILANGKSDFMFQVLGKGQSKNVIYQLPKNMQTGQLTLFETSGRQINQCKIEGNKGEMSIDLPLQHHFYILTLNLDNHLPYSVKLLAY